MKKDEDLFGNEVVKNSVRVNIYADEIQPVECPSSGEKWFYIGIIVENLENPLLPDIILERYCGNPDPKSPYYSKNDRRIHWSEIDDIDTKNIAKRWIEYILNPAKSGKKFYIYILGINDSKLNRKKFGTRQTFNAKYNRFFRSALLYALKCFFPGHKIIVENIFHEEGQQEFHEYFPWHSIYKIKSQEKNISFNTEEIIFLPKDHRKDRRSNIIQLIDLVMGLCKTLLHGIKTTKRTRFKEELLNLFLPLFKRMIEEPENNNSKYDHAYRIMIRFFPKSRLEPDGLEKYSNQFYTRRDLYYIKEKLGYQDLPFRFKN